MFEDIFGQLIGEIVTCCLEYSNNMVDYIRIYMNFLDDDVFSDFCFSINDITIDKYFISNEIYMDNNYIDYKKAKKTLILISEYR